MTTFGKEKKKSDRLGTSRQRSHLAKNHDENWHFPKLLFYNLGIRLNDFQHKICQCKYAIFLSPITKCSPLNSRDAKVGEGDIEHSVKKYLDSVHYDSSPIVLPSPPRQRPGESTFFTTREIFPLIATLSKHYISRSIMSSSKCRSCIQMSIH